jgi:hypothetical protein
MAGSTGLYEDWPQFAIYYQQAFDDIFSEPTSDKHERLDAAMHPARPSDHQSGLDLDAGIFPSQDVYALGSHIKQAVWQHRLGQDIQTPIQPISARLAA